MSKFRSLAILSALLLSTTVLSQPRIQSISPNAGPIGTEIEISGTGFDSNPANNQVWFGAVKGQVLTANTNSLRVKVPFGATYQPVVVTVAGRSGTSRMPFHVTFPNGGNLSNNSLAKAVNFPTGLHPNDLAVADFDGDGLPDLATANNYSLRGELSSVSILRNSSQGGTIQFESHIDLPTEVMAYAISAGDLDGDGKQDLVTTSVAESKIVLFRNTSEPGQIRFAARQTLTSGDDPFDVTIADFDNNGLMDIAVTNFLSNTISLYQNKSTIGNLSFTRIEDLATGEDLAPNCLTAADFDGDGKFDLAVTFKYSNTYAVFTNQSSGSTIRFGNKLRYFAGDEAFGIAVGDYTGDRNPDLIFTNNHPTSIWVHRNNSTVGKMEFQATTPAELSLTLPKHPAAGDINGDGKIDAALTYYNRVRILQNGYFPDSWVFRNMVEYDGNSPYAVAIGDLNRDGFPEVITTNFTSEHISVYKNQVVLPSVERFDPAIAGEGTKIIIKGNNFSNATAVLFGGIPASSFTIIDSSTIEAITGKGAGGAVEVINNYGSGKLSGFTFTAPPVIESFTPDLADSGVVVTITGINFIEVRSVLFGGSPAVSYEVVSPSVIKAKPGLGSTGAITIVNAYGTGNKTGFRIGAPVITAFSPATAGRKDTVTITGTNFQNVVEVDFGNSPALSFTILSPTEIRAVVGGGNTGAVGVRTVRRVSRNGFNFQLPSAPKVLSVQPLAGISGSIFTISGSNFNSDAAKNRIVLGQVEAKVVSATQNSLQVKVPTGAGIQTIEVMNLETGLQVHSNQRFTVTYPVRPLFDSTLTGPFITISDQEQEPRFFQLADFNRDGKLDVFGAYDMSTLVLRQNKSTIDSIAFGRLHKIPVEGITGYDNLNVRAVDLDGDGWLDLITASNDGFSGAVNIFRNNATPDSLSFTHIRKMEVMERAGILEVLDFDGDGRLDFLVMGNGAQHYRNTSAGPGHIQFERINADLPVGMPFDLDNDGKTDLLREDATFSLAFLKNTSADGIISYAAPVRIYQGYYENYIRHILPGDVDGDGAQDILLINWSEGKQTNTFLLNKSSGNEILFEPQELANPNYGSSGKLVDIDGDGKLDYVVLDFKYSALVLHQNISTPGNAAFKPGLFNISTLTHVFQEPADVDNDGKMDVLLSDHSMTFDIVRNRMNEAYNMTGNSLGICPGGSRTLVSNVKQGNQWYKNGILIPGATNQILIINEPGKYSLTAMVDGVLYTSPRPITVYTSPAPPAPVITKDYENNLISSSPEGNQWYLDGTIITGATAPVYKPIASGNYTVRVTQNECTGEASLPYYLIGTGVVEVDNNNETLAIFPNPVKSSVTIQFKQTGLYTGTIRVFNATGTEVLQQPEVVSGERVNLSSLSKGYYLLQLINPRTNTIIATRKFMKL
jgi:hypothetical protein